MPMSRMRNWSDSASLVVDEFQQPRARFDQRDLHADRREHAGVFGADHSAADDDHARGQLGEREQFVAVDHAAGRRTGRSPAGPARCRRRSGRARPRDFDRCHRPRCDAEGVRIDERWRRRRASSTPLRSIWLRMTSTSVSHHVLAAVEQVVHRDVLLDGVAVAVDRALAQAGQVQHGFADGLGGDGAGVDADAADAVDALDERDALAELGGVERRLLPGGAGTDDHQIVMRMTHNVFEKRMSGFRLYRMYRRGDEESRQWAVGAKECVVFSAYCRLCINFAPNPADDPSVLKDARRDSTPASDDIPRDSEPNVRSISFGSAALVRVVCLTITTIWILFLTRLFTEHTPVELHWSLEVFISIVMLATGAFVALHQWRYWAEPARDLAKLLPAARAGETSIESLGGVRGGLSPLVLEIQQTLRDLRSQRGEVARLEQETRDRVANRTDALERSLGASARWPPGTALTGLYNRRMLDVSLPKLLDRCRADGAPLTLLMLDVDDFKLLNDTLGHPVGDELLRSIGQLIRSTFRESDVCFRFGGDEFVVLLPNTDRDEGDRLSERLASLVDALTKPLRVPRPPRLSIGVLSTDDVPGEPDAAAILRVADATLYDVKFARKRSRVA